MQISQTTLIDYKYNFTNVSMSHTTHLNYHDTFYYM